MATPMCCWRHHFRTHYYWKPHRCWKESQWSGIPVGMEPWRFNHSPRWHYAHRGEACNEKICFFDVTWIISSKKKRATVLHFHRLQRWNRRQFYTFTDSKRWNWRQFYTFTDSKRWNWRQFYTFTDPSAEIDDSSTLSQIEHSEMRNCQNHNVELAGRAQRYDWISCFFHRKTSNHNVDSRL